MLSICNGSSGISIVNQGNSSLQVEIVSCISTFMNKCMTIFSDILHQVSPSYGFFSFEGYESRELTSLIQVELLCSMISSMVIMSPALHCPKTAIHQYGILVPASQPEV
jgi:hypothetical protein